MKIDEMNLMKLDLSIRVCRMEEDINVSEEVVKTLLEKYFNRIWNLECEIGREDVRMIFGYTRVKVGFNCSNKNAVLGLIQLDNIEDEDSEEDEDY